MVYQFFDKKSSGSGVGNLLANKSATEQIINLQINFISKSLENLGNEKFTHLLETIFAVLIWLICKH